MVGAGDFFFLSQLFLIVCPQFSRVAKHVFRKYSRSWEPRFANSAVQNYMSVAFSVSTFSRRRARLGDTW